MLCGAKQRKKTDTETETRSCTSNETLYQIDKQVTSLSPGFICACHLYSGDGGADSWLASYLILLLESVALRTFHLGDVLEEVGHADRRVQLTRLVRHVDLLPLPQGVSVRLHQAAGVAAHVLAFVCGAQRQGHARAGQHGETGSGCYYKIHMADITLEAVNGICVFIEFTEMDS